MNTKVITLWDDKIPFYNEGSKTPNRMTFYYAPTHRPVPCVVIFPGGAYYGLADHEGEPIAEFFTRRGIHAAVVEYRTSPESAPNHHPAPLADAKRAVQLIRHMADELYVDKNRIVTLGSSAGGHLAACTITLPDVETGICDEVSKESTLPNGAVLCYPVINIGEAFGHVGSGMRLLGDEYEARCEEFSLENRVNENTPQVFLWHTAEDAGVNVKNSLVFGEKLRDHNIPFEMHIFPYGPHGLGLAAHTFDVSKWADFAADWILRNV